jgi:hypothetical protein
MLNQREEVKVKIQAVLGMRGRGRNMVSVVMGILTDFSDTRASVVNPSSLKSCFPGIHSKKLKLSSGPVGHNPQPGFAIRYLICTARVPRAAVELGETE